jgi:hypothetical protein
MGWLDKLLGRKKSETSEGMQTAPPPASMPEETPHEHTHGEGEHSHEHEEKPTGGGPA